MNYADAICLMAGLDETGNPKKFLEAAAVLAQPETRKHLSNNLERIVASLFKRNLLTEDEHGNVVVNKKKATKRKKKVNEERGDVINQRGDMETATMRSPEQSAPMEMDYVRAMMLFDGSIEPQSAKEYLSAAIVLAKDAKSTGRMNPKIGRRLQEVLDTGAIYKGLDGEFHIDYDMLSGLESR